LEVTTVSSKNTPDSQNETIEQEAGGTQSISASDPVRTFQAIMDGLAETVLEASDEELLSESSDQGNDPIKEAEEVRAILLDALKAAPGEQKRTP
jgi:hypothetical protein